MFRSSNSLLKLALTRRTLATGNVVKSSGKPGATAGLTKTSPVRRILLRVSLAVSLFYAGGIALSEYNDSFGDLFVDNVPFAENLVDLVESYRYFVSPPLTLEELRSKFGAVLGEKVLSVPQEGVKAGSVDKKSMVLQMSDNANDPLETITQSKDATLLKLGPITAMMDSNTPEATEFNCIINSLNETVSRINNHNVTLSKSQYGDILEAYQKLTSSVCLFEKDFQAIINDEMSSRTQQILKETNDKYKLKLKEEENALTEKFLQELHEFKNNLEERSSKQLQEDLKANEQTLLAKHANEVALLSITQVEEFNKILKEKLDTERDGRLAHLKELDSSVGDLGQSVEKLNHLLMKREAITQITLTLNEIKSKLNSSSERSLNLTKEIQRLKTLSDIIPDKPKPCCKSKDSYPSLLDIAISELSDLTKEKEILSNEQLYSRWNLLESDFKTASLLPPNAGILGHTFAKICSFFIFTKKGSSPSSNDFDSVFARVNENLRLAKLDKAVEEVVSLKGWPHILGKNWIADARRKIEVESLVNVLECEVRTL